MVLQKFVSICAAYVREKEEEVKEMKKLLTVLFAGFLTLSCMTGNVHAEESILDYSEEISMFLDFYEHPGKYIFQDSEGNDVSAFVFQQKENFQRDAYHTTDFLMETVKSVQEETPAATTRAASKSKTWNNLKVYFQKNRYCIYSVTGTYNVSGGKITNGKAVPKIVDRKNLSYNISYIGNVISKNGKTITFSVRHIALVSSKVTVTTKHTITI